MTGNINTRNTRISASGRLFRKTQPAKIRCGVIALGVLLFALLWFAVIPANYCASREAAMRAQCAFNLRKIGQSIKVYSSGNRGRWPTVYDGRTGEKWGTGFDLANRKIHDRGIAPDAGDPFTCNLSCWWILVREDLIFTDAFICPSHDGGVPDISVDPDDWWCFEKIDNCSYSYQNQLGKSTTDNADADLVVAADRNPMRGDGRPDPDSERAVERFPHPDQGLYDSRHHDPELNSPNHEFEGQNCLYADGHVMWQTTPYQGIDGNNIWLRSSFDEDTNTWTEDTGSYSDPTSQIGHSKDSFLVP